MHREVIRGPKVGFLVLSQRLAEQTTLDEPYVMISITNSRADRAVLPECPQCLAVCRVSFDDVEQPVEGFTAIQLQHAERMVAFARQWLGRANVIMVHCEVGVSRSAGVAAALSKAFNGTDAEFFRHYTPNARVYRMVLEAATPPTDTSMWLR